MLTNKLDKKWYGLIWVALIIASLIRNIYIIYSGFESIPLDAASITLNVLTSIIFYGLLPALMCYLCGSILHSMALRRRMLFASRGDFTYIIMIFTAGARFLMGVIELCSLFNPNIYYYTIHLLDLIVLTIALLLMYFLVLKPKYINENKKVAHEAFKLFSTVYLTVLGVITIIPCISVFVLYGGMNLPEQYVAMLESYFGQGVLVVDPNQFIASIIACSVFALAVIVAIILTVVLKKKAKDYVEPIQSGGNNRNPFDNTFNPYEDYSSRGSDTEDHPFEEMKNNQEKNVFDEFDI